MAFSPDDIRANREYFVAKLRANEQQADVVHWVKKDPGFHEIVLLDARSRDAFNKHCARRVVGGVASVRNCKHRDPERYEWPRLVYPWQELLLIAERPRTYCSSRPCPSRVPS